MAYFPNGTSGEIYNDKYCVNCLNWRDTLDGRGVGCAIIDLHMVWNYDQLAGNSPKAEAMKLALETLIPTKADGFPGECNMYLPAGLGDVEGQQKMFPSESDKCMQRCKRLCEEKKNVINNEATASGKHSDEERPEGHQEPSGEAEAVG